MFSANSTCLPNPQKPLHSTWPGEKCTYTEDCSSHASKGCLSGVCVGSNLNEICNTHNDCNPGFRCFNLTCQKQLSVGGVGCATDYDCVNGAGCNIGPNLNASVCYPYFSINTHLPVGECSSDNINLLCNSATCQSTGDFYECMNPVKSPILPNECETSFDCLSTQDIYFARSQLVGQCYCGYNQNAQSYCNLFPGDDMSQKTYKMLQKWVKTTSIDKCNTAHRFYSGCMNNYWSKRDVIDYMYYSLTAQLYPLIVDSEECIQQTFLAGWYQAKQKFYYGENHN